MIEMREDVYLDPRTQVRTVCRTTIGSTTMAVKRNALPIRSQSQVRTHLTLGQEP
jgi:hypothetical protein